MNRNPNSVRFITGQCCHQNYSVEDAIKRPGLYVDALISPDTIPLFSSKCTDECREKMIKITQYVFKFRMNSLCWFFHDAKIVDNRKSNYSNYICAMDGIQKEQFRELFDYTPQMNEDGSFPDYPNV